MIKSSNNRSQFRSGGFKHRGDNNNTTAAAAQVNNIKIEQPDASNEHEHDQSAANYNVPVNYVSIKRLDEAERQRCRDLNLCFRCRKPGHRVSQCEGIVTTNRSGLKPSVDIGGSKKY